MQIDRCKERGTSHAPLLTRRLLVLLAVGLMHYLLIVMAGARVADAVRSTPAPAEVDHPVSESPSTKTGAADSSARVVRVYAQGTYREILNENVRDFLDYLRSFAPRWWFGSLLPAMLLGAYVARR